MYQAPCSTSETIISTLQSQAKKMENELREWNKTVFEARNKFYELNYFTTIQLLLLRQELGAMNAAFGNANVPSNILALLRSISFDVTSENVCRVVKDLVADLSKPKLQEDQLTHEQKGILTFVVQRLGCPKLLVLKAFEMNQGKEMNGYDCIKWCNKNLTEYKYEDEDEETEDKNLHWYIKRVSLLVEVRVSRAWATAGV